MVANAFFGLLLPAPNFLRFPHDITPTFQQLKDLSMQGYGKGGYDLMRFGALFGACLRFMAMLVVMLSSQAHAATTPANSIKRYLFSAPDQAALQQQFKQ